MKTPDEINKSIEVLRIYAQGATNAYVTHLTYGGKADQEQEDYIKALDDGANALAYIEQLERERDAAIEDIKKAAIFICQTCKKYHPAVIDETKHFCDEISADHFDDGAIACGMYEWRGAKEWNG